MSNKDNKNTADTRPKGPVNQPYTSTDDPAMQPITEKTAQRHTVLEHPKPYTKEEVTARVKAFIKLTALGAAPAVTLDRQHTEAYSTVYRDAVKDAEQERYDEIVKQRKILGLGTAHDQMGIPESGEAKAKRLKADPNIDDEAWCIGGDNRVRTPEHHAETAASGYMGTKPVDSDTTSSGDKDKKGGVLTTKNFGL